MRPFIKSRRKIKKSALSLFGGSKEFAKNVIWANFGLGSRILFRTLYFIIVARILGVEEFGLFSGVRGLVLAMTPFVGWGTGIIMIKNVSREPSKFKEVWGSAVLVTLVSGIFLGIILAIVSCVIFSFEVALKVMVPIVVGDFWGLNLAELSARAFQAHQKLSKTSLIWMLLPFYRFLGALMLWAIPFTFKGVETWSIIYMVSGLAAATTGMLLVKNELGWGRLGINGIKGEWKNGFYFSVSTAASGAYNDIDKTFLSRFAGNEVAGFYSAAYRIIDAVYVPVNSIIAVSFPKFFQVGCGGLEQSRKYAMRLIPRTLIIAGLAWGGLLIVSPFLLLLLGSDYQLTLQVLRWLGAILLFRAVHNLLANALTGANYQGLRSYAQVFIALFNVGLNFWLIPLYGWHGAVWSSLLSDGGLVLLLAIIIVALEVRSKNESLAVENNRR